jgi:hypothetical protein
MKFVTKEFLGMLTLLIGGFLILEHATGFSKDVGALASGTVNIAKTLQGR